MNYRTRTHKIPWAHILPDARVWKSALAATVAWELAQLIGSSHPFFAPLAAILCMQATVEQTLRKGFQRMIGIGIGVVLASVAAEEIGIHGWSIGVLMLIALGIGRLFQLPEYAYTQIGVSALLVLTVGSDNSYGLDRLLETLLGAAVAALINLAIIPPDYTASSLHSLKDAADKLAAYSRDLARWIRYEITDASGNSLHQAATAMRYEVSQAVKWTEEAMHALKFSPFVQRKRQLLKQHRLLLYRLELGYIHAMELQQIMTEAIRTTELTVAERERWEAFFLTFAEIIEDLAQSEAESDLKEHLTGTAAFGLSSLNRAEYNAAFTFEAHQLLQDFVCSDHVAHEHHEETRLSFQGISDGKSRGHDLTEN